MQGLVNSDGVLGAATGVITQMSASKKKARREPMRRASEVPSVETVSDFLRRILD